MTDWRFHCWYWGDAIAIDGLLEADALGAGAYRDIVVETLQRWHRILPAQLRRRAGARCGDHPVW